MTVALLVAVESNGLHTVIASQSLTLSGSVKDKVGDVRASAQLPKPPDFIAAALDVRDGNLTVTVSFAPGTLSPQTNLTVYLDTDEDVGTGTRVFFRERRPIGADYAIRGMQPHNPSKAAITRQAAASHDVDGQYTLVGYADVTFPTPDQRRIVVPLAMLGNDDGRLAFKIDCDQVVAFSNSGNKSTQTNISHVDQIPDAGARPGTVR